MPAPRSTPPARPGRGHRWLALPALCGAAPSAWAQGSGSSLGAWLFACLALLLVAGLGWRAGRRDGAQSRSSTDTTRHADPTPAQSATAPLPATAPALDHRSLEALCADLGGQVRVCRRGAEGGEWQLVASQPALAPGQGAFDGVPAAVAFAARNLAPGSATEAEGWRLRCSGEGDGTRLVMRLPAGEPAGGEDPAAFSFTVSHDLRAPVRVVEGFTRILKEDYGRQLDRIGNDHLDRVLAAAARMNAMIDAMLSLARISSQPIARQPVDLSKLGGYVVDELRKVSPERVVDVHIAPDLQVVGDPTLLRQVVENLLSNAWKYTGRCERGQISFNAEQRDGRRVFQVRDNGAGFDMRSAERLFGLFQRLHGANEFPGTGVGLASVQRIVRRHGGEIWAEAEPGRGACFSFTLRS